MNFAMETLIFGRRCFLDPPVISPHTANLNKSPNSKIYLAPGFQMRRALEKSPRSLGTHCTPGLGPSRYTRYSVYPQDGPQTRLR